MQERLSGEKKQIQKEKYRISFRKILRLLIISLSLIFFGLLVSLIWTK